MGGVTQKESDKNELFEGLSGRVGEREKSGGERKRVRDGVKERETER